MDLDERNFPSHLQLKLKLHFQRMSEMSADKKPLVFQTQTVKLGFIQYCLNKGTKLSVSEVALEQYLDQQKESPSDSLPLAETLSPADMSRKKLAILFAHLSAFHYDLDGLTIEPVTPGDLVQKIQDINLMKDDDVVNYLDKLIGEKIPGHEQMPIQDFLTEIQNRYQDEGVKFHCYLRENFSNPLDVNKIEKGQPALNYFMPTVFCQQHINTCDIATSLTMLKKIVKNFNQMQDVCFSTEIPQEVIDAQKEIAVLEQQFERFLQDPSGTPQGEIQKLTKNYHKQVEIIQTEMEKALGQVFDPECELFKKQDANHSFATVKHLVMTRIIPGGFAITNTMMSEATQEKLTPFQRKSFDNHFDEINKTDVVKGLHHKAKPDFKQVFLDIVKKMFLFGKTKTNTESIVCGHSLIMDIDGAGKLKIIEHKNAKPQETLLSHEGLIDIGIHSSQLKDSTVVKTTLDSIAESLSELKMERENIRKIQEAIRAGSAGSQELDSVLEKKDAEIRDLLTIVHDIKVKHGLVNEHRFFKTALTVNKAEVTEEEIITPHTDAP